jgi:hypothetical protein
MSRLACSGAASIRLCSVPQKTLLAPVPNSNRPPSFHISRRRRADNLPCADLSSEAREAVPYTPHGHVWATRYKLRSRSSLLQPNHLRGAPPFRPSNPCYCVTFCRFVSFNYPQHRFYPMIVKTQHPAPTTAFSGRSIISSSANLEGTTVGPTCESLICRSPTR